NPHSVTKDQISLGNVDNVKQLAFTALQVVLVPSSDNNVPSSKAVADHVALQMTAFTTGIESRLASVEVSTTQHLPMSYFETVLTTTSEVNVPSSSAIATFIKQKVFYTDSIAADQLSSQEVTNLITGALANGTTPWLDNTFPADQLNSAEVINIQSGTLANGTTPWLDNTFPADQLNSTEVTNIQSGILANGTTPWLDNTFPADQLNTTEVTNMQSGVLANGNSPWLDNTFPADQLNSTEVANIQSGVLANGQTPWLNVTFPADGMKSSEVDNIRNNRLADGTNPWFDAKASDPFITSDVTNLRSNLLVNGTAPWFDSKASDLLTTSDVTNLRSNVLADGSSPWTSSEAALGVATSGQILAGDRTWINLDASTVGLNLVQNLDVKDSFTQNIGSEIGTSKIRANNSTGLSLVNQSNQGIFVSSIGYVGINTNAPSMDLEVMGDAKFDQVYSQALHLVSSSINQLDIRTNSGAIPILFTSKDGGVGIYKTNPTHALDVSGNLNIDGRIFINGAPFSAVIDAGDNFGTAIVAGASNIVISTNSIVIGGSNNIVYGENSIASGGLSNEVPGHYASVAGGILNTAFGLASGILAGSDNEAIGLASGVVGGEFNIAFGVDAVVAGGFGNRALGEGSFVAGGVDNVVHSTNSAIVGGNHLSIEGSNVFGFNGSDISVTTSSTLTNAAVFYVEKFGIGNSDPSEILDISGRLRLRPSTDAFAHDGTLRWSGSDLELMQSGSWGPIGGGYAGILEDSNGVQINISGTTRFVVDSLGRVGINTTNPIDDFHVVGNTLIEGALTVDDILVNGGDFTNLQVASNLESRLIMDVSTTVVTKSLIQFSRFSSPEGSIQYNYSASGVASNILFEVENTPRMMIRTDVMELVNGLGIKYSDGSMQFTASHPDKIENGVGNNKVVVHDLGIDFTLDSLIQATFTTAGNLGLGETSPQEKLVVDGRVQLKISTDNSGVDGLIRYSGQDIEAMINGTWSSLTGQQSTNGVTSDTITALTSAPFGVNGADAILVQNDIFVFGGEGELGVTSQVFKYSILSDTWTTMANMPVERTDYASIYIDNFVYLIGGRDDTTDYASVLRYDPVTDGWTQLSGPWNYPSTIVGASAAEFQGYILVVGGNDGSSPSGQSFALDPSSPFWNEDVSSTASENAALIAYNGLVYKFGGTGNSGVTDRVEVFDGGGWSVLPSLPVSLTGMTPFVLNGDIYLLGGYDGTSVNDDILKFDPDTHLYSYSSQNMISAGSGLYAVSDGQQAFFSEESESFYRFDTAPFVAASGDNAFVGEGLNNSAEATNTAIIAGFLNKVTGDNSIIGGGTHNAITGFDAFIGGGVNNLVTGDNASVIAGEFNTATGISSTVLGGFSNLATGLFSTVLGGQGNTATGAFSSVVAGDDHTAAGDYSTVLGGQTNTALGTFSTVLAGNDNDATALFSAVVAGASNDATAQFSTVLGGNNNIVSGDFSSILAGQNNTATGIKSAVLSGHDNGVGGNNSVVVGGYSNYVNSNQSVILGGSDMIVNTEGAIAFNGTGQPLTFNPGVVGAAFFNVEKFSVGEPSPDDTFEIRDNNSDAVLHLKGLGSSIMKLDATSDIDFSQIYFSRLGVTKGGFSFDHNLSPADEVLRLSV
ncbi:hypothetical protein MJH12_12745, partial [bacterium]|nr:hypothetical protein [bacterium]